MSIPILFLLTCYLSLYFGAFSFTLSYSGRSPLQLMFMVPALWVAFEYVRAVLFSGLPWELMGYSQYKVLPIAQLADLFGVYGVSFLIALSNAAVFLGTLSVTGKGWQGGVVSKSAAGVSVLLVAATVAIVWIYGDWRIKSIDRLIAEAGKLRVSVVQGNIEQAIKWDPDFQKASIEKYLKLSEAANRQSAHLIVWPETATPFYLFYDKVPTVEVFKGIQAIGTDFLIGSPSFTRRGDGIEYRNTAYLLHPDGKIYGKYDKVHLVPFGEYVPFKKWLPFLGKIVAEVGDFMPGKAGHTMPWRSHRLGMLICFEIIFPDLARSMTKNNAALLINITNDAWFGKSSAPYQHFSMASFRAIENRRTLVRSANTGISGFIGPTGKILATTPLFKDATLTRPVPLMQTKSVYTRIGDLFAWACVALAAIIAAFTSVFKRGGVRAIAGRS